MRFIGDGDSSVFARIHEEVPVWGHAVVKMECANHAVKCLRGHLEKLVVSKPHYKGAKKLTKATRVRLATAVRCAIKMRTEQRDTGLQNAAHHLANDIRNCVHHVFGNHTRCSIYFCKVVQKALASKGDVADSPDIEKEDLSPEEILCEQSQMWTEGTSEAELEESRGDGPYGEVEIDKEMLYDISVILSRVADKADRLLGNFTTNLAESWMSIRMKFDGGKVFNRCQRGSWHGRCNGGGLRKNLGCNWSPKAWSIATKTEPGRAFDRLYAQREYQHACSLRSKKKSSVLARGRKRRLYRAKQSTSKRARLQYGEEAIDVRPDISVEELELKKQKYLTENVCISPEKAASLEERTRHQSHCAEWHQERKKRLTASNFGEIIHKRPATNLTCTIRKFLYGTFKGNAYTRHGLKEEASTIKQYKLHMLEKGIHVEVKDMGLRVHPQYHFLAASPDGHVIVKSEDGIDQEEGLIEMKNLLKNKDLSFVQAVKKIANFPLMVDGNGELH